MKQIQYFMTEDKTQRIVSYTLWLEEGHEKGNLTFSKRETPDDVWEPPITMKSSDANQDNIPVLLSEEGADYVLEPQGFKFKEVIEDT